MAVLAASGMLTRGDIKPADRQRDLTVLLLHPSCTCSGGVGVAGDSDGLSESLLPCASAGWNPALELPALPPSQHEWSLLTAWCEGGDQGSV